MAQDSPKRAGWRKLCPTLRRCGGRQSSLVRAKLKDGSSHYKIIRGRSLRHYEEEKTCLRAMITKESRFILLSIIYLSIYLPSRKIHLLTIFPLGGGGMEADRIGVRSFFARHSLFSWNISLSQQKLYLDSTWIIKIKRRCVLCPFPDKQVI